MKRFRLNYTIQLITQITSKGTWRNWRFTLLVPHAKRVAMKLVDASYVGALLAGALLEVWNSCELGHLRSTISREFARRAERWVLMNDTYPSYHFTTITLSRSGGKAVSISTVDRGDVPIFKAVLDLAPAVTSAVDIRVKFKISMAKLFASKQAQVVEQEIFGSDAPWVDDLWNFSSGDLTISMFDAAFEPTTKTDESFTMSVDEDNDQHLPNTAPRNPLVGCQSSSSVVSGIFSRSTIKRLKILYNPKGYNVTLREGTCCVVDCIAFHLNKSDAREQEADMDGMQADNGDAPLLKASLFLNDVTVKALNQNSGLVTLEGIESLAKLADVFIVAALAVKCTDKEREEGKGYKTVTRVFNKGPKKDNALFLIIYPDKNDRHYHASVISSNEASGLAKCVKCFGWYIHNSRHFINCVICKDCYRPHQKGGKHYLSCKGAFEMTANAKLQKTLQIKQETVLEKQLYQHVHFADFECFTDKYGRHIPYLIVLKTIKANKPQIFWGEACLEEFIEVLFNKDITGYLFFHNGSGYDFNLVITGLLQYNKIQKKKGKEIGLTVLRRGTKILTAEIKTRPSSLKLRDFYLYIPTSLAKLCVDFKVPSAIAKLAFDHTKIKSFSDAELYKPECVKYCINDVDSLEFIYIAFSGALWKIAPNVLMPANMSLASQALEMWKVIENAKVLKELTLPQNLAHYNIFRNMYHGGRVLATIAKYDTPVWRNINNLLDPNTFLIKPEFNLRTEMQLGEALKMVDVVSLYPFVMFDQRYPYGTYNIIPITEEAMQLREATYLITCIRSGRKADDLYDEPVYQPLKELMFRSCYQVDMDCDPEIIVAFLMRKNEDPHTGQSKPEQSLAPLRDHWLTGVELFESIKVGYKLLKVKSKIVWKKSGFLFKKYIECLFKVKQDNKHDKTSALYIAAKLLMNALSGKFGQKIVSQVVTVLQKLPDDPESFCKELVNIKIEIVEGIKIDNFQSDQIIGYVITGDKKTEDLETNLPTHLSVFILAHSRRTMSKMLRHVNGYKDPKRTFFYTDTDSMVITSSTFELLKDKYIGSKLGQLEDEFPADTIIAARFLAPKTYCLAMLRKEKDTNSYGVAYKVRCKGIPHRGDVFLARDYELGNDFFEESLSQVDRAVAGTVNDLKERYYVLHSTTSDERITVPFISISVCDMILSGKYYINVHYGTILRGKEGNFVLSTTWAHRSVGNNNWWLKSDCPRELRDEEGYEVTKCRGYVYESINADDKSPLEVMFIDDGEFTILSDFLG